jgi:predicted RNA-binding protein with PUA-like domain
MPWLFKSEPDVFSFADLKARPREPWSGVRNYQARNYMRDEMEVGDLAFFYHSSCPEPGIAGILKIVSKPYADPTQFEPDGEYEDPKSTAENPRWQLVDVAWKEDFKQFVSLDTLRNSPALAEMKILQKGNRLSITPVTEAEFKVIRKLGGLK